MARTTVVTGSASGIGRAIADLLRERGERVIGVDLKGAEVTADLSTAEGCAAMVEAVTMLAPDGVDAVIANAGVLQPDALCIAVNYHGAIRTLEGLRPLLARSPAPRAVVTASLAVAIGAPTGLAEAIDRGEDVEDRLDGTGYAVSKRAIGHWVRRVAPIWARAGILLNAVCPGLVETPMQAASMENPQVPAMIATIPMGRIARPRELAELFAFLASEANSYMSGQLVFADGGLEAATRPELC
ncbi:SDR family oxidoreductase [Flavisphingomonas formosensis]|uniref:SDR family oxidoreductase n=1 Tax=Flavisphingomonas formosensis TaxID=861534 RepID=UPI0012FCD9D5|nr:SDR family oxidoreductase [Sphingomonas formosensis]